MPPLEPVISAELPVMFVPERVRDPELYIAPPRADVFLFSDVVSADAELSEIVISVIDIVPSLYTAPPLAVPDAAITPDSAAILLSEIVPPFISKLPLFATAPPQRFTVSATVESPVRLLFE